MDQMSFSDLEYVHKKKKTRREKFLEQMDGLIPWKKIEKRIKRHYPKAGKGRHPYPLSTMLRIHCMQLFYNLSDPAMEDALYEIESMRRFSGLSLSTSIPDETTILKFRHLLEKHNLGRGLFEEIKKHLDDHGLIYKEGSIVDATIISAPSSTKNKEKQRDPEMYQTRKGNEWYFGMKMHIGVDDALGVIHSIETTSANVHDVTQTQYLLHGEETRCWGDAGYTGIEKREEVSGIEIDWLIAKRLGNVKQLNGESKQAEKIKAQVRAKVEHSFRWIKRQFGYDKVRYRGLMKNKNRLYVLSAFTNLLTCKKYLPA